MCFFSINSKYTWFQKLNLSFSPPYIPSLSHHTIPSNMSKYIPPLIIVSYTILPIILRYSKKLKYFNQNTYIIEFGPNHDTHQFDAIKYHLESKHHLTSVTLKDNIPYIEATVTESHEGAKFIIEITHTTLIITLSSPHLTTSQLARIYQRWLHDKLKHNRHRPASPSA